MEFGRYSFERKDHLAYGDVVLLTLEESKNDFPSPLYVGAAALIPREAAKEAQVIWANKESLEAFLSYFDTEDFLYMVQKPFNVYLERDNRNGSFKNFRKRPARIR